MPEIQLLTQETIDKIAAGEVVERPSSVVKELVENAIDAGASAITVEIKEGGISFIRITDNGCGIRREQVPIAFLRHSTSKIRSIDDLIGVSSLGFRGEALSSIAAISRTELITKTQDELTGTRYLIEGSREMANEEVGAPEGTTFLVRDLFYNTPARRKFLKTATTEGNYITDIVEKLALSHPDVSFKYIQNNQTKLHTSGNGNVKDLIYHIFGREIAAALLPVSFSNEYFSVTGFIGKPNVSRGNRNYENYFIRGRYVKSSLLSKAIEEAYRSFMMQHQYPFTALYFDFTGDIDVNVHPTKMELRFGNNKEVYTLLANGLYDILSRRDMIPQVPVTEKIREEKKPAAYQDPAPEPFEVRRLNDLRKAVAKDSPYEIKYPQHSRPVQNQAEKADKTVSASPSASEEKPQVVLLGKKRISSDDKSSYDPMEFMSGMAKGNHSGLSPVSTLFEKHSYEQSPKAEKEHYEQTSLEQLDASFLTEAARSSHKIIGQVFQTYWLVEFSDQLYIIDQHAAHEKVLYERTMKQLKEKEHTSQLISPPIVMTLDVHQMEALDRYRDQLTALGYEIEHFGGKEYMITAVPDNLYHIDMKELFVEMLDDFQQMTGRETPELILEKVASMSCKAAVKGNNRLSRAEIESLIDELLTLENPYNCPHGRPTIISMTKYELEKKFKRIV